MDVVIKVAQLLLGLSLLVFVHELGHFLAAKAFNMRVDKFFIFFDAWGKKIWSKKIGETEYGIGWLPLGGYVRIAGMIDETQDAEQLSEEPEEWEFRSKPAWQRFIVMIGGVVMNVITGLIIFTMFLHTFEKEYLPVTELNKQGIFAHDAAQEVGLKTGDKIVAINGTAPERFKELTSIKVLLGAKLTVERNGKMVDVQVPEGFFEKLKGRPFIEPMEQYVLIESFDIPGGSPKYGQKAGLKKGDRLTAINGEKVMRFSDLVDYLDKAVTENDRTNNVGGIAEVEVEREGKRLSFISKVDTAGKLGFAPGFDYPYQFEKYTWGSAFKYSYREGWELIMSQLVAFKMMFTGKLNPSDSLASPIAIAQVYGSEWDWARFWKITGLLSFILAFMNILPIPALDGGHIMFIIIETIIGRKLSDQFMEKAQIFGFVLLMGLMVFAFGNDIYKWFVGRL